MLTRTHRSAGALAAVALLAALVPASPAAAAPTWPTITTTDAIGGFDHPTNIVAASDGTGRLFVTEQVGRIRVIKGGVLLPTPALDIHDIVGSAGTEQGLLGLAFPPGFSSKQYAYIYFTNRAGSSYFYRVRVSASDPDRFDRSTMQLILKVGQPYANHNGGQLAFGPDGFLYIGLGDGGSAGDPGNRAQNLSSLLGKILRLSVESTPAVPGYRIPTTNPFRNQVGRRPEIWTYGMRNPWRFSFDTATGDLWIGDVGQNKWEEIDRMPSGARGGWNFGWARYEGTHFYKARSKVRGFAWPVAEYSHAEGEAVTGGFVYHGPSVGMEGIYFFGDYGVGKIWGLQQSNGLWVRQLLLDTPHLISTFGVDENGDLWYADWSGGVIYKVVTLR